MAIVVVEGIDRVGKTTFTDRLQSKLGPSRSFVFKHDCSIVDYASMDDDNETDKMVQLLEMYNQMQSIDAETTVVIFDRFHVSNAVYGIVERGYDFKNACENFNVVDAMLHRLYAHIVYVKPTSVAKSSAEHGTSLKLHDELFDMFMASSSCRKVICDYYSLDAAVDYVLYDGDGDCDVRR